MLKKILLAILLLASIWVISGCQTIAGLGEDITWTAENTANLLDGQ
jgi:predicted small secreted protein